MSDKMKMCLRCNRVLAFDRFCKKPMGKNGRNSWCKDCCNEYAKTHQRDQGEYHRKYVEQNAEKIALYRNEWLRRNRDKANLYCQRRAAKKKMLPSTLTVAQWEVIKREFGGKCAYCGKEKKLTQDHFIPISQNGEYTMDNIIPACRECNTSKCEKNFFKWYPAFKHYDKKREIKILGFLHYKNGKQQIALAMDE